MTLRASSLLTQLLRDIVALLSDAGFIRTREKFLINRDQNVGLIEFQKSRSSSAARIIFTINIGVWSGRVAKLLPSSVKSEPLDIEDCHWRERIGFLLSPRSDRWWTLETEKDLESVRAEIIPILERSAIPAVVAHLRDADLRDEWLAGNAPGLTNIQRLLCLTALLKEIGPAGRLAETISELRREAEGRPTEAIVLRHLQRWGVDDRHPVVG